MGIIQVQIRKVKEAAGVHGFRCWDLDLVMHRNRIVNCWPLVVPIPSEKQIKFCTTPFQFFHALLMAFSSFFSIHDVDSAGLDVLSLDQDLDRIHDRESAFAQVLHTKADLCSSEIDPRKGQEGTRRVVVTQALNRSMRRLNDTSQRSSQWTRTLHGLESGWR